MIRLPIHFAGQERDSKRTKHGHGQLQGETRSKGSQEHSRTCLGNQNLHASQDTCTQWKDNLCPYSTMNVNHKMAQ